MNSRVHRYCIFIDFFIRFYYLKKHTHSPPVISIYHLKRHILHNMSLIFSGPRTYFKNGVKLRTILKTKQKKIVCINYFFNTKTQLHKCLWIITIGRSKSIFSFWFPVYLSPVVEIRSVPHYYLGIWDRIGQSVYYPHHNIFGVLHSVSRFSLDYENNICVRATEIRVIKYTWKFAASNHRRIRIPNELIFGLFYKKKIKPWNNLLSFLQRSWTDHRRYGPHKCRIRLASRTKVCDYAPLSH